MSQLEEQKNNEKEWRKLMWIMGYQQVNEHSDHGGSRGEKGKGSLRKETIAGYFPNFVLILLGVLWASCICTSKSPQSILRHNKNVKRQKREFWKQQEKSDSLCIRENFEEQEIVG